MKLRVNLMLPEEHQQSGKAQKVGFAKLGAVAAACLLAAYATLSFLQNQQSSKIHSRLVDRWTQMEEQHNQINAIQKRSNSDQAVLDELKRVRGVSIPWTNLLGELQTTTPPAVQMVKLELNGRQEFVFDPAAKMILRSRTYEIKIHGKVIGEKGTDVVTEYVRKVPVGTHFSSVLKKEDVHLDSLQREMVDDGAPESHKFMMNINLKPLEK